MAAITPLEVFEFVGAKSDVRIKNESMMLELIDRVTIELEGYIGRTIESTAFTNVVFQHGVNCQIHGQKLFLKGRYRDIYSISAITEENIALTAVTGYNDGNDYYFDTNTGILVRKDQNWSQQPFAIKMSGSMGLVDTATELVRSDVKEVLVEMVATKSGLWKTNVQTVEGDITTIRTNISSDTKAKMDKLKIKGV